MIITANTYTELAEILQSLGYQLVADLPAGTSITRKGKVFTVVIP